MSIGRSISRTTASSAPASARRVAALAQRGEAGEPLAAGRGGVVGQQAGAVGDRLVELEHVLVGGRLGAGDPPARGRAAAVVADAAVLGDHALDGSEDLLHRRVLLNIPHDEGVIAYCGGSVTGLVRSA